MTLLILLPFGDQCPKCRMPQLIALRWCRGCDDALDVEHLHKVCICGYRRVERCADAPVHKAAQPPDEKPPEERSA